MKPDVLYGNYLNYLTGLIEDLAAEDVSQDSIAQNERNQVAAIENEYMKAVDELHKAKQIVRDQYRNVWESCTSDAGLRRPSDQRPVATTLDWREAVRVQELAAVEIRKWFAVKSQKAAIERDRELREKAERQAAMAVAQAETEAKQREAMEAEKRAKGKALLESLKNKYRR